MYVFWFFFILILSFALLSIFAPRNNLSYYGQSKAEYYNNDWTLSYEQDGRTVTKNVTLPHTEPISKGTPYSISKVLDSKVETNKYLCLRSSQQNVTVLIDGEERADYRTRPKETEFMNSESCFIFVPLSDSDRGKTIDITYVTWSSYCGISNDVLIGDSAGIWLYLMSLNYPTLIMAFISALIGFIVFMIGIVLFVWKKFYTPALMLSLTMISTSLWVLCESRMRQLYFPNNSVSAVFSFIFLGVSTTLLIEFVDEMQSRRYGKLFKVLRILSHIINLGFVFAQLFHLINLSSYCPAIYAGIAVATVTIIITVVIDYKRKNISAYSNMSMGIIIFSVLALLEIVNELFGRFFGSPGLLISMGLIQLMVLTVSDVVLGAVRENEKRQKMQERTILRTIATITATLEARDKYTGGHSRRVADTVNKLAEALGYTKDECKRFKRIAELHDIGKVAIPDAVLNKPEKLTDEEYALMKLHTTRGEDILSELDIMPELTEGAGSHHERWDGKGYPRGLKGEEIPVIGRILCLADSFDAMASSRVYRKALSIEHIRSEIERCSGTQFDPEMAKVFISLIDKGVITSDE